jgi:hypothetical protein
MTTIEMRHEIDCPICGQVAVFRGRGNGLVARFLCSNPRCTAINIELGPNDTNFDPIIDAIPRCLGGE